jgi:hypothetical protein
MRSVLTRMFVVGFLAVSAQMVGQARGDITVPVDNGSFENPLITTTPPYYTVGSFTGWTVTGMGGVQVPGVFGFTAIDGAQDAWMHSGGSMEQTVGSYDSSSSYTLTYHAGELGLAAGGQYEVALLVGSTVLASYTSPVIANYTWDSVTTTLTAAPDAGLSGLLTIQFAYVSGFETDIDAVSLTSSAAVAVPEPSSLLTACGVLGVISAVSCVRRRRRLVADLRQRLSGFQIP